MNQLSLLPLIVQTTQRYNVLHIVASTTVWPGEYLQVDVLEAILYHDGLLAPLLRHLSYIVLGTRYAFQIPDVAQSIYESMNIYVRFDKFMFQKQKPQLQ